MSLDYAAKIQQLLEERARHAEALVEIDKTLEGIGALLGTSLTERQRGPGRPPKLESGAEGKRRPKRGRGAYEVTADQFVLDFVKEQKNPTTREINAFWKSVGRGHNAGNTLVRLVKMRQLKRVPLEGERGSRYVLP